MWVINHGVLINFNYAAGNFHFFYSFSVLLGQLYVASWLAGGAVGCTPGNERRRQIVRSGRGGRRSKKTRRRRRSPRARYDAAAVRLSRDFN